MPYFIPLFIPLRVRRDPIPKLPVLRRLWIGVFLSAALSSPLAAAEVNVYSYRQPALMQPLFDKFTTYTGIIVNSLFAEKGLAERIKAEGVNSPADIILASDIARLSEAVGAGMYPAGEFKSAYHRHPRILARSSEPLVRADPARSGDLCLQRAGEAG